MPIATKRRFPLVRSCRSRRKHFACTSSSRWAKVGKLVGRVQGTRSRDQGFGQYSAALEAPGSCCVCLATACFGNRYDKVKPGDTPPSCEMGPRRHAPQPMRTPLAGAALILVVLSLRVRTAVAAGPIAFDTHATTAAFRTQDFLKASFPERLADQKQIWCEFPKDLAHGKHLLPGVL